MSFDPFTTIGDNFNIEFDFLGVLLDWLLTALEIIWNGLVTVLNALAAFFLNILRPIANLFRSLWDNFLKGIFTKLVNAIIKAHDWLEEHLGPIIKWVQRVRAYIDRLFNTYIRPILDTITKIHQALSVLKALHIQWAAALDAKLSQIEGKIASVFLEVRSKINQIIDVLDIIIDPERLLRHPQLIVSIRRSVPAIFRVVTGMPIGYFLPATGSGIDLEELAVMAKCGGSALSLVTGLPFPVPFPTDGLGNKFTDTATGLSVSDWSQVQPLAFFQQNFISPQRQPFDSAAFARLTRALASDMAAAAGS